MKFDRQVCVSGVVVLEEEEEERVQHNHETPIDSTGSRCCCGGVCVETYR